MSELKPTEVSWSYDLGVIPPFKYGVRTVVTQVLADKRANDPVGGNGYYYTNTYVLGGSFGAWKMIEPLFTHAHKTLKDAVDVIPSRIEEIKKRNFP